MKIKLMIVALVAVSGLWGSERGQLVSMKNEEGLRNAFVHCIDTKSYGTNRFKRPIVICCFTETNNKDAIHNLTKKVIDEECKMVSANFAQYMNVYLRSGANINIKNVDSDQWIDKDDTNK